MEASPPTPPADDDPRCSPCRGTGKVVSSLGGTAQQVDCPWCEGTGVPIPEHDAQARWREGESAGAADA